MKHHPDYPLTFHFINHYMKHCLTAQLANTILLLLKVNHVQSTKKIKLKCVLY